MTRNGFRGLSRRRFVRATAAAVPVTVAFPHVLRGMVDDKLIRIGVIGAGNRGCGACRDAMAASSNVQILAAADLWNDRLTRFRAKMKDLIEVDRKYCFAGFDAYKKVLEMDLDYVILATPPHYRPLHFRAAIESKKHVFMEKPAAVDPVGIRELLVTGHMADQKRLSVVAGTQRRHQAGYVETIKRLHDGAIGRIRSMQLYWNQGQLWSKAREQSWSDDEWMHRDWVNWCWLSGDHVVEQHVHSTDIANWVLKAHPIKANAMGGRQRRVTGDQYDFFVADLTYPDEIHVHSECRQISGCSNIIGERAIGEKGWSDCNGSIQLFGAAQPFNVDAAGRNPYVQEHTDLIAAIRTGKHINEARNVAESTMTSVMIRISAYTGNEVTWDGLIASELAIKRPDYELTPQQIKAHIPVPGDEKEKQGRR